jgi:hypothetical protein
MIVGFNRVLPFDADARREYLKTFTKEAVAYYNNKYRHWPAFPMYVNKTEREKEVSKAAETGLTTMLRVLHEAYTVYQYSKSWRKGLEVAASKVSPRSQDDCAYRELCPIH